MFPFQFLAQDAPKRKSPIGGSNRRVRLRRKTMDRLPLVITFTLTLDKRLGR